MAAAFNLTAELNLRGPANLNQVISGIRRELSTLTLDLNINPNTSRGIQSVTANIRNLSTALRDAQTNAVALSNTLSTLVTGINNVGNAANNIGSNFNRLGNSARTVGNNTRQAASEMEEFGRQSALAVRRFAAFSVGTGAIYGLAKAISSAYSEFVNFNREFVRLQQVTNTTAAGLSGLSQEITRLSTGLGVSSQELLNVATTLAQAGLSAGETKTALEALAKSALAPSFDSLNDTVEGSIALMRQFGLSAGDLESALGSINAVAAKFAVEAGDIITAIQRTGGVFANASKGVSQGKDALNEFIAVFTSVRATTRESAETIATGLRTIFTRIQRGATIQSLKEFGIVLTDLEGKFVGPYEAIRRLSQGLQSLDPRDLRFSQIVEDLGGFRQIGKVIPLIQQFATAQQALSVAQRGAGSLAADQAKAQEALAVRITRVREEFIALIRDIGQTQSFQKFVDISLKLASALISVASAAKDVLPAIAAIAAIRAVPAIGQYARGVVGGLGRRREFATGGLVPGSGNRDTVPAMLTPGEFVIRKKAVETIGVQNLARMNTGGTVQKFAGGSPGGVRKGIDWKNLSRGRGRKGSRGARSRFDLPQPGDPDYLNWVKQIYAEYDADPSLPRVKVNGVPTPPEIAYAEKLITQEVFERGGSGMMLGYDAKGNEVVGKFGRSKSKKSGKLKKTPLGLLISAAGMQRGARAPTGEMQKILGAYEKDPEYRKAVGLTSSSSVQQALSAFRKSGGQTSLAGVFSDSAIAKIEAGIPKYIETLTDEPQKIAKAKLTQQYLRSFAGGATASKAGHATAFSETINQMLKSGIIQEFANGGAVQKFANGGKPLRQKMTREDRILQGMVDKSGVYQFGVASLRAGAGKKEDVSFFGSASKGQVSSKLLEQFTIPGNPPKKGQFYVGTLATKGLDDTIESTLKKGLGDSVTNAASILASQIGTTPVKSTASLNRIYKGSGFQSVIGSSLEAAIASIGSPYIDKTEAIKSFDFPLGLGPAASLFGIPGNIPTDATRTIGGFGKGKDKLIAAATRFVQAVEGKEFTKARMEKIQSRLINKAKGSSLLSTILETIPPGLNTSPSGSALKTKYGLARSGLTRRGIKGSLDTVAKQGKDKEFLAELESEIAKLQERYATGGSVQDTVPALLTPGEFVINKNAAQRIGYSKLNTLNKADKIQGFNKGGTVGNVQSFAGGGIVQSFAIGGAVQAATQIARQLPQLASSIAQALRVLPRNIPQGAGWLSNNAGTRAMGLPGRMQPMNMIRSLFRDPMSLVFGAGLIGEGVSGAIGGKQGEALGSAVSGGAGIAGVVASIVGVSTPLGALATVTTGLVAGFQAYSKAIKEATIQEEQRNIESRSGILDKSFQNIISSRSKEDRSASTERFLSTLSENIKSEEKIRRLEIQKETPTFNLGLTSNTLANTFNYDKLGSRFAEISKDSSSRILDFINQGLAQNQNLETILQQLEKGGVSRESSRMAIGLSSIRSTEISQAKARVEAAEYADKGRTTPSEMTQSAKSLLSQLLNAAVEDFKKQASELKKVNAVTVEVIQSLRPFAETLEAIAAASSRASSEFAESRRKLDISVGSAFGGETKIGGVSRMNEQVLSNLRAYSPAEISSVFDKFGARGGLNKDLTERSKAAALSQRVLQIELPTILENQIAANRSQTFDTQSLTTLLDPLLQKGGVKDENFRKQIIADIDKSLADRGDKTIEEVLSSSNTLNTIIGSTSDVVEKYKQLMKDQNDVLEELRNSLNNYVDALQTAINGQIQATQIRLQAENQLAQTLGKNLSITQQNTPFNREILDLTRNIGAGNRPIPGTGTLDPTEIARRLEATEKRRKELETSSETKSSQQLASELTQVTLQSRQLEAALKKLATDGTRAANALNKLQTLRQERFARQNAFFDFARNANNPEFLTNFINDASSLRKILSGGGGLEDVEGAIRAFELRANSGGIDAGKVEEERNKFGTMLAQRFQGLGLSQELIDMMFKQTQSETNAIADFKTAIEAQAQASELAATRTRDSANDFYDRVLQAADDFLKRVGGESYKDTQQSTNQAQAQRAGTKSNGGLIYASKGKFVDFQPKGSDTVPAMLTPGEFVVNAQSAKKNLGLLKQINSSGKAGGFSRGGVVYLAEGGTVEPKKRWYKFPDGTYAQYVPNENNELIFRDADGNTRTFTREEFSSFGVTPDKAVISSSAPKNDAKLAAKYNRKQAFLEEKERRKQAAMANNPGYAAKVGKEEAKKAKERQAAIEWYEDEGYVVDTEKEANEAIKAYRRQKARRSAELGSEYNESQRKIKENPNLYVDTSLSRSREEKDKEIAANRARIEEEKRRAESKPILSDEESKNAERRAIKRITGQDLTREEYEARNKPRAPSSFGTTQTPEEIQEQKERNQRIAENKAREAKEREKRNRSIAERQARDADARTRINPATGKPFKDAAEEAGLKAKLKAQREIEAEKARGTGTPFLEDKKRTDRAAVAAGQNAGVAKAQRIESLLLNDPAYENERKQPALIEYIKARIQEKYSDDLRDSKDSARDRANLERLISSATADFYNTQRTRPEVQDNSAQQNLLIALDQFNEGVNKSPILAPAISVGKSAFGLTEATAGGIAYVAGGLMDNPAKDKATTEGNLGASLKEWGAKVAGRGGARIRESGATLGVNWGLDTLAGGAYAEAAAQAQQQIQESTREQVEASKGLYSTESLKQSNNEIVRTIGELLTSENITQGLINTSEVVSQAAAEGALGETRLAQTGQAAISRGISGATGAVTRGMDNIGTKLVDKYIAMSGPGKPLRTPEILTNTKTRLTDALEARRAARETRRGQGALTREALREAETGAKIAEANRGINVIPMEDIERDLAARVTRGYETNQRLAESGIPPLDFSDKSFAQIAKEASENITPENIPKTTSNFSRTRKSTDTVGEPYEMSSREDFLKRQAETQARKQAITQSGKPSGSISTPLDEPKASGRITLETPETKPSVTRQEMETEAFRRRMEGQTGDTAPPISVSNISTSEDILMDKVARIKELTRTGISALSPSEQEVLRRLMRDPEVLRALNTTKVQNRSLGGLIYASKGTLVPYQPRGTDTVPAMLTPGEFVVNRKAAKQNMGLLKAINSNKVQKFQNGGIVQYLATGTDNGVQSVSSNGGGSSTIALDSSEFSASVSNFNTSVGALSSSLGSFNSIAGTLAASMGSIGTAAASLSTAASVLSSSAQNLTSPIEQFKKSLDSVGLVLSKIPSEINFKVSGSIPVIVSVEVNGGDGLSEQLKPFAEQIFAKVSEGIRQATNGNLNVEISSELIG